MLPDPEPAPLQTIPRRRRRRPVPHPRDHPHVPDAWIDHARPGSATRSPSPATSTSTRRLAPSPRSTPTPAARSADPEAAGAGDRVRTGLGWAPDVPDHWSVVPLNYVAKMGTGHTPDRNNAKYWEDPTIPWVTTPDVTRRPDSFDPLLETEQKISALGLANSAAVLHPPGTVMLSRTASVGYSIMIGRPMATTQAFVTWNAGPRLDANYLLLVIRAMKQEWARLAYGSTHLTIYMPDLEALSTPLPPIAEQRRIVSYLSEEVARVDQLIAFRRRQVDLAVERMASLARTETGRTRFRRDSDHGNSNWRILELRRVLSAIRTGGTPSTAGPNFWSKPGDEDRIPWYGPSSVGGYLALGDAPKFVGKDAVDHGVVPRFLQDSILVVGIGATAGRVAYLDHEASGNQQMTCMRIATGADARFFAWQLWAASMELKDLAPYTTLPILNNDYMKSFLVAVPGLDRQRRIASRLDSAADELRALERAASRANALVAERRQALITAAVCGRSTSRR